jgi:hypothetical protein
VNKKKDYCGCKQNALSSVPLPCLKQFFITFLNVNKFMPNECHYFRENAISEKILHTPYRPFKVITLYALLGK